MFDASAKQALYNTARKKRNYCSPATAFLTRWSLPISLSRLSWQGFTQRAPSEANREQLFTCRPVRTLEYHFMIRKA